MSKLLTISFVFVAFFLGANCNISNADVFVDFRDVSGNVGDLLESSPLGTPVVVDAVNAPGLTITATAVTGATGGTGGVIFADTGDFAVNSSGVTDDADGFDPGESITFQFNQSVAFETIDFSLSSGESITFAGVVFTGGESPLPGTPVILGAGIADISANPIVIPAFTNFTIGDVSAGATSGSLQDLNLSVVPEPSSVLLLLGMGVCGLARRKR